MLDSVDYTKEEIERVLKIIQSLDPAGIGARDLKECLLIQLKKKNSQLLNNLPIRILEECYDDFKNKRFEKMAKKLSVTLEEVKDAIEVISRLNPKPGEGYLNAQENYIIPDFIVEKVDDQFVVSLNDWNIPSLRISETYKKMLADKKNTSKDTKEYIKQKIESAKWFITSIHQRRLTMSKVMNSIVEKQKEFFEKGPGHLNPMILKNIADMAKLDISTVSRVTNGKYVQTDYGVFELKYFFSEGIENISGEEVSTKEIKAKLKELIENEDSKDPLSDEQIVELLKNDGYNIARRTVAKYREQLMIPVARLRRKI
jgi:RNA polymerase sigma-54 factor